MKWNKILLPLLFVGQLANAQFVGTSPAPLTTTSKITIGSSAAPYSTLDVISPPLAAALGSQTVWSIFAGNNGNNENLRLFQNRYISGTTDWTTSEIKLQKRVDLTNQQFISFRGMPGYGSSLVFGNDDAAAGTLRDQMIIGSNGFVGINIAPSTQRFDVKGNVRSSNEIIATMDDGAVCQFRAIQSGYGFMLRNDGYSSSFLITGPANSYGSSNGLRPFAINNASGEVNIANGTILASQATGKVTIGLINFTKTNEANCKLFVVGGIMTEKVKVMGYANWADYVFAKEYQLTPLKEVEKFIRENNHLAEIPSAKEIETSGLDLGELVRLQMLKIEELTLYLIEQNKRIEELEKR